MVTLAHDRMVNVPEPARPDAMGMFYDMDAAILATFGVDDSHYRLTHAQNGELQARIELTRRVRSLDHLTRTFYRFWGCVALSHTEVTRRLLASAIEFAFVTSDDVLSYRGRLLFTGEPVARLLEELRKT